MWASPKCTKCGEKTIMHFSWDIEVISDWKREKKAYEEFKKTYVCRDCEKQLKKQKE